MSRNADEDKNNDDGSATSVTLSFIAEDSNEEDDTFFSAEEYINESNKPRTSIQRSNFTMMLNKIKRNTKSAIEISRDDVMEALTLQLHSSADIHCINNRGKPLKFKYHRMP